MDLRLRLLGYLSGFSLLLLALAGVILVMSLRQDVDEEIGASTRLVDIMLTVSEARQGEPGALQRLIDSGRLRHVTLLLERSKMEHVSQAAVLPGPVGLFPAWLVALALPGPAAVHERRIAVGDATLVIRADPGSEIRERLRDAARVLGTLLLFSLGTMLLAWHAAQRALQPVRAFEEGLERLARGEEKAVLPPFELKEFRRIAGAIDRLAASLAEARAAQRRLARRLMEVQEAERRELARELHDEFGQSLTAIGVAAAFVARHAGTAACATLVECAVDIRTEAARVASHVRGLLAQLRPHGLEGLGIADALRELVDTYRQRAPALVIEALLPPALPPLPSATGLALYRALQEALTNIVRHSGARHVRIVLAWEPQRLLLTVADDGCGRANTVQSRRGGGLLGMGERTRMAGGQLTLADADGDTGGLLIALSLPLGETGDNNDGDHQHD